MFRAIKMVLFGLVAIGMCWFPVATAILSMFKCDVKFSTNVKNDWRLWWETLEEIVG